MPKHSLLKHYNLLKFEGFELSSSRKRSQKHNWWILTDLAPSSCKSGSSRCCGISGRRRSPGRLLVPELLLLSTEEVGTRRGWPGPAGVARRGWPGPRADWLEAPGHWPGWLEARSTRLWLSCWPGGIFITVLIPPELPEKSQMSWTWVKAKSELWIKRCCETYFNVGGILYEEKTKLFKKLYLCNNCEIFEEPLR